MFFKTTKKKYLSIVFILLFIVVWTLILSFISPEDMVNRIGVRNGYIFLFLLSILGGVSTISSTSFYLTLVTLAIGGLNPFILGTFVGIGVTAGDTLYYYLGRKGSEISGGSFEEKRQRFISWLKKKPSCVVLIFTFLYCALIPLPTDIIAVALGLCGYPYQKIILPIFLGNIVYAILVAYLASIYGIQFFS